MIPPATTARHLGVALVAAMSLAAVSTTEATATTRIERIVTPGGIEAWLVRESAVPIIALQFAVAGGAAQDANGKSGTANLVADMLDEGAGELDSNAFHDRLDEKAVELHFHADQDYLRGGFRTLVEHREAAFELFAKALNQPRFDAGDLERVRQRTLATLRRKSTNPNALAYETWWATAFPDHPYGRTIDGTIASVTSITSDDLKAFARRTLTRDALKIAVVGDIDAATLAPLLDKAFAGLPVKGNRTPVVEPQPQGMGDRKIVDLDVPQSVAIFGWPGLKRNDPDFIPAFVLNHILGGGTFSSHFYREVREKRGLAYSVYSYLMPLVHAGLVMGGVSTRNDRVGQSLSLIEAEIKQLAVNGPTADELEKAKKYLIGSYSLRFDTSTKIAEQLLQIQLDDLGIDYIQRRNDLVAAVTIEDLRRVAARLLQTKILVTVVGRPRDLPGQGG